APRSARHPHALHAFPTRRSSDLKRLVGNYWQADEVNMASDVKQFPTLTEEEKDAYLKIIGLLSTLDAPQTRTALLFSLYATDPSVQSIMAVIAQQEAVHNESY